MPMLPSIFRPLITVLSELVDDSNAQVVGPQFGVMIDIRAPCYAMQLEKEICCKIGHYVFYRLGVDLFGGSLDAPRRGCSCGSRSPSSEGVRTRLTLARGLLPLLF
jgi:hypothetical protein